MNLERLAKKVARDRHALEVQRKKTLAIIAGLNPKTEVVVVCRECAIAYPLKTCFRNFCAQCGSRVVPMLWTEWETYQSEHTPSPVQTTEPETERAG